MNKDELIELVKDVYKDCGNHRDRTALRLSTMAEDDPQLMIAFAKHGELIVAAVFESDAATKH